MNCGMSRSGVSVPGGGRVESVLKPSPSGGAVTFTSGSVCDCWASAARTGQHQDGGGAIGRFLKRDMGLPLVLRCLPQSALAGQDTGSPGWPSDAYLVCC